MTVRELLKILLTDLHQDDMDKPVYIFNQEFGTPISTSKASMTPKFKHVLTGEIKPSGLVIR